MWICLSRSFLCSFATENSGERGEEEKGIPAASPPGGKLRGQDAGTGRGGRSEFLVLSFELVLARMGAPPSRARARFAGKTRGQARASTELSRMSWPSYHLDTWSSAFGFWPLLHSGRSLLLWLIDDIQLEFGYFGRGPYPPCHTVFGPKRGV